MLSYYHDYRTMQNIAFDYGVSKRELVKSNTKPGVKANGRKNHIKRVDFRAKEMASNDFKRFVFLLSM
jgi:hypothetical protein